MGAWRNSTETQQLGHEPRFGPEGHARETQMQDNSKGGELDPADDV